VTADPADTVCRMRPGSRWTKCRCPECLPSQLRAEKQQRHGYLARVPPETAWTAFTAMIDAGWSTAAIGSACDLNPSTMQRAKHTYLSGGQVRFGPVASERLTNPGTPTVGYVPARVAARQLRALACHGWSLETVADVSGVSVTTLRNVQAGRTVRARADAVTAVDGTYAKLAGRTGTSAASAARARVEGWAPSYAWTDITDLVEHPKGFPRAERPARTRLRKRRRSR